MPLKSTLGREMRCGFWSVPTLIRSLLPGLTVVCTGLMVRLMVPSSPMNGMTPSMTPSNRLPVMTLADTVLWPPPEFDTLEVVCEM